MSTQDNQDVRRAVIAVGELTITETVAESDFITVHVRATVTVSNTAKGRVGATAIQAGLLRTLNDVYNGVDDIDSATGLRKCKLCGGRANIIVRGDQDGNATIQNYRVSCNECETTTKQFSEYFRPKLECVNLAIEHWNRLMS